MSTLTIEDLSVRYGQITAVREVSLHVEQGEFVAIVGPNGAGKTSLLKVIAGALPAAGGRLWFDGEDVTGRPPEDLLRRGIALVPEERRIFATLTVRENLALGATVRTDRAAVTADLRHILDLFPVLERFLDRHAGLLSGGEQQQLAIARALLSAPRLLVLDEPSLGLAPKMVALVFSVLERLRADGITILLVEQRVRQATAIADRSYVMRNGAIVAGGDHSELHPDEIDAAYFGSVR